MSGIDSLVNTYSVDKVLALKLNDLFGRLLYEANHPVRLAKSQNIP
jgi:hypothetical protein